MRILYSHRIRSHDGQGVHLEALVAALRDAGHQVEVVGPPGYASTTLGQGGGRVALLRRLLPGFAVELAELAYSIPGYWRLRRAARQFHPDVIYERANLFYLAGALLARRLGIPLLLEVNSPLAQERAEFGALRLRRIARGAERFVWRSADRVLPVTAVLGAMVAQAQVRPERIIVVPNGIDIDAFPATLAAQQREGAEVVLGFVGFVRAWHGLDAVLRAMAAATDGPRWRLDIVGEGPAREDLAALAMQLGIAERVRFAGLAARAEIPARIAAFDIALQPACVPYASPLKVFEYMAAGRAIVAPDQPNIREVLAHDHTALLFPPGDAAALCAAVSRLAGDPALRARLGAAARTEAIRRDFTWAGNARRVGAMAQALCQHSAPPRSAALTQEHEA